MDDFTKRLLIRLLIVGAGLVWLGCQAQSGGDESSSPTDVSIRFLRCDERDAVVLVANHTSETVFNVVVKVWGESEDGTRVTAVVTAPFVLLLRAGAEEALRVELPVGNYKFCDGQVRWSSY